MKYLAAGTIWINRYGRPRDPILPTGGYKSSGIGKDLGRDTYHGNRRTKSVLIDLCETGPTASHAFPGMASALPSPNPPSRPRKWPATGRLTSACPRACRLQCEPYPAAVK